MQVNAYVHASTSKQELGPQAQRDRITAWCQQHGHDIAEWYEDQASGGTDLDQRHVLIARIGSVRIL